MSEDSAARVIADLRRQVHDQAEEIRLLEHKVQGLQAYLDRLEEVYRGRVQKESARKSKRWWKIK